MPNENSNEVSLKELRKGFYKYRSFEIFNLWQRSLILTAFSILCFTAYGFLVSGLLNADSPTKLLVMNEIACGAALFGLSFAVLWIMMAKGSKAWYEVYERYICDIEMEERNGVEIPEHYRLGALCEPWELDSNLFSKKAGRYSPSRLNIMTGMLLFIMWITIFAFHYAASIVYFLKADAVCWVQLPVLLFIPVVLLTILITAIRNTWGRSRSLVKP